MTTQADIREWLERGQGKGATHVIVMCDTFDWDDYPVFVDSNQNIRDEVARLQNGGNMQKIMEVYNLSLDIEAQINEDRSFNF